ncbi:hypothetical protein AXG93_606s1270 [Marchantia polymorpha subsp. ruderalis]|uniref:Uncharacterized protein n=1 Tax=Marchantia polymorpha subsp. ruderalis TaxID=1480154 RepID=A0A176VL60_MARPO|nr:hypothetical protein AXG93_606s1270 [Marchantia polymorpha subsp. ruderalis]
MWLHSTATPGIDEVVSATLTLTLDVGSGSAILAEGEREALRVRGSSQFGGDWVASGPEGASCALRDWGGRRGEARAVPASVDVVSVSLELANGKLPGHYHRDGPPTFHGWFFSPAAGSSRVGESTDAAAVWSGGSNMEKLGRSVGELEGV